MDDAILIVDDQTDVRRMLRTMLTRKGFHVVEAESGEEALRWLSAGGIRLVITDLLMPGLDGIATIRELRNRYPSLKIIAMSGAFGADLLNAAGQSGADGLLTKPLLPWMVVREIERVNQIHDEPARGAGPAAPEAPRQVSLSPPPPLPPPPPPLPTVQPPLPSRLAPTPPGELEEPILQFAGFLGRTFTAAGIEYRLIGGLAIYLYLEQSRAGAGRVTKGIDLLVRRADHDAICSAAAPHGWKRVQDAFGHLLVSGGPPLPVVRLLFAGEPIRPNHPELAPEPGSATIVRGLNLLPLAELIRMILTTFRAKDEAHLKELDDAGLITPAIETTLDPLLTARLRQMRERG